MNDPSAIASSSVLAFVTTIHAAMVVLTLHRGRPPRVLLLALPSFALTAMPWFLSTPGGLVIGLLTHLAWFAACEKLGGQGSGSPSVRVGPLAPLGAPLQVSPTSLPASSPAFVDVPVLAVHQENATIRTFRLTRPPGFDFQAGQFLTVRVEARGRTVTRCYSVSSAPDASGYLEISVKRQGTVSGILHDTLRPGSVLAIRRPAGRFVYPSGDDRPIVLLAGGIGVTPLLSMLRHAVLSQPTRPVTLLYSVRSHSELAFADELAVMARRHLQTRVVVTITGEAAVDLYRHGRIDESLLRETVRELPRSLFFMCGPLPMIDSLRAVLAQLGVPEAQVHAEAFAAAVAGAAADGEDATRSRVTFARSRREVEAGSHENLLEVAERAGVLIPSMCRAGACGTCRTRLVAGEARSAPNVLNAAERAQGWVLPCVTTPAGDCVLEA